jgi:hypothetical protein
MKKCTRCENVKLLSDFSFHKAYKNNIHSHCKQCLNEIQKHYSKTKNGLIIKIYGQQRASSKLRGHDMPNYTKHELAEWIYSQPNFEELYNNWVKSNYKKDLVPSCDRLDDYKPYTLDNIRLVTYKENRESYYNDQKNGINNKNARAVFKFDLQGNFIKEYYSIHEASRQNKLYYQNIYNTCIGRHKTCGGYVWKYKD